MQHNPIHLDDFESGPFGKGDVLDPSAKLRGCSSASRSWPVACGNCTDVLSGGVCSDLEIPRGSTYAQAARKSAAACRARRQ